MLIFLINKTRIFNQFLNTNVSLKYTNKNNLINEYDIILLNIRLPIRYCLFRFIDFILLNRQIITKNLYYNKVIIV